MDINNAKSVLADILPSLEDFLKTILLKKFGTEILSTEATSRAALTESLKNSNVVVRGKETTTDADVFLAFDEQWIPQLSSAMLGVEENEINEITTDLIKEFSTQLFSTAQIALSEKDINVKPGEVDIVKEANIAKQLNFENYIISEIKVEGKFEIEGDEKPELHLWVAFNAVSGGAQANAGQEEELDIDSIMNSMSGGQEEVSASTVSFKEFGNAGSISQDEVRNLDVLRDVEIDISVELGRKSLPLGEILHLVRGSVIELNKLAGEPVEVYANGHQIATGEVVVIDEHFGVRVTQLVSARERLESLSK